MNKKKTGKIIVIVALAVLAALIVCAVIFLPDIIDGKDSSSGSKKSRQEKNVSAYTDMLKSDDGLAEYALYDIDSDGVPELITHSVEESDSSEYYRIFTCSGKKAKELYSYDSTGVEMCFYAPKDGNGVVMFNTGYRGSASIYLLTFDGGEIKAEILFEAGSSETDPYDIIDVKCGEENEIDFTDEISEDYISSAFEKTGSDKKVSDKTVSDETSAYETTTETETQSSGYSTVFYTGTSIPDFKAFSGKEEINYGGEEITFAYYLGSDSRLIDEYKQLLADNGFVLTKTITGEDDSPLSECYVLYAADGTTAVNTIYLSVNVNLDTGESVLMITSEDLYEYLMENYNM